MKRDDRKKGIRIQLGDYRKNKENRRCDNDVIDENDDEILREQITKGVQ